MKKLLLLLALVVAAWLAWTRYEPLRLDGKVVPENTRVAHVNGDGPFDPADKLNADTWTLVLFTSSNTPEERTLSRQLEVAVREHLNTLRLVIVEVRGLGSQAAQQHGLTELPTLWLYDGYRQVTKRRVDIEKAVLGQ